MKILKALIGVFVLAFMAGCSQQIPPAHVGKILTPTGYEPEVLLPSKVWIGLRESLYWLKLAQNGFQSHCR